MNKAKAIIFDFDYTLADSSRGVISCINYALGKMGMTEVTDETACRTIGMSLPHTYLHLCDGQMPDRAGEFGRYFVEQADRVMTDLTVLYDDVPQTLRILKERGYKLGIVSGKFRYRIEEILMKSQLIHLFNVIIGGEDVVNHKPHSEGVLKAVNFLNVKFEDVIYVGDSIVDAETVKDLNIPFVVSLTGATTKEEFADYKVYRFIQSISELTELTVEE